MSSLANTICSQCDKIKFDLFTNPGPNDHDNETLRTLEWSTLYPETCHFCQLLRHCINPSGEVYPPFQGTLHGFYAGNEIQLRLAVGGITTTLEYSIQLCRPTSTSDRDARIQESVEFDIEELKHWLEECQDHHCFPADEKLHSLPDNFRLIDVNACCIVRPQESVEYCALSYVWGDKEQPFKLESWNEKQAEVPGFLASLKVPIPKTIRDAIALCQDIGCYYLWVDSLCIVQDSKENKHAQIASMAEVYSQSRVTFIAATGIDSNAGLAPYGGRNSAIPYLIRTMSRGTFVASLSPQIAAQKIATSTWASRGWTLQEYALARRVLFFTGSYAFLRCKESLRCEDFGLGFSNCYEENRKWDLPMPPFYRRKSIVGRHYPSTFSQMLAQYVRRSLSKKEDIVHAFTGILTRMEDGEYGAGGIGDKHIFGLPSKQFGAALQWTTNLPWPGTERADFPSWSWAGWIHATDPTPARKGHFHDMYEGFDDQNTNISVLTCYIVRGDKYIKQLEEGSFEQMLFTLNEGVQRYQQSNSLAETSHLEMELRRHFTPRPPHEVLTYIEHPNHSVPYLSQHVFLWASCATLYVDRTTRHSTSSFPIRLKDGRYIGSIRLKPEWRKTQPDVMPFFVSTAGLHISYLSLRSLKLRFKVILTELCRNETLPVYKRIQVSRTGIFHEDWALALPESKFIALV
jgi:hypothetical protein